MNAVGRETRRAQIYRLLSRVTTIAFNGVSERETDAFDQQVAKRNIVLPFADTAGERDAMRKFFKNRSATVPVTHSPPTLEHICQKRQKTTHQSVIDWDTGMVGAGDGQVIVSGHLLPLILRGGGVNVLVVVEARLGGQRGVAELVRRGVRVVVEARLLLNHHL